MAFDTEIDALRPALATVADDVPLMDAIRSAVVQVNHYALS